MKKTTIFSMVIVLILLLLALVPGCTPPQEPTPVQPSTTPTPTAPSTTLPTPGSPAEFKISPLSINPTQIIAGEEASVNADITNVGENEGSYTAILRVDGVEIEKKGLTLAGGEKTTVSFTVVKDIAGTYKIEVGGQTGTLTVLTPVEIEVSSLTVTPALVLPGQEATVEADITNTGKEENTIEATLKVNGVDTDSMMLTLPAGATEKVLFTIIRDLPGTYEISIREQSTTLTVPEVKTYKNEDYNYSINYPSESFVNELRVPASVIFKVPDGGSLGVEITTLSVGTSLDDWYRTFVGESSRTILDFREVSITKVKENGEVVAYDAIFTYPIGNAIKQKHIIFSKKGRYGFARYTETLEGQTEPLLEACLNSFKAPEVAVGTYTSTTHGFSMTLPYGWDGLESDDLMPLLNIENPEDEPPIYTFIFIDRIYETTATKDYAEEIATVWSEETSYKIISQKEVTLGKGTPGYEVLFTYQENGYDIKRKVVSVIRGTQVFTLLVYTLESTYDSKRSTIDQLVNSFTLIEPKPFGVSRQNSLFLWEGEIVTLDPALTEGEGIIDALFSGLVKTGKDWEVVPDIAERWDISEDGRVYTFHLREGVKFHDGKPVTAYDFKYSWERACDPETDSRKASTYLGDIVGAKEMLAGEATELSGVRVIDDYTLEVTIDSPKPYFLGKLTWPTSFVLDRANVARGMNWTDNPNGTGPFKLKEWEKDELVILERNNDYYLKPAKVENLVFQLFAGRRMMMYEQGEIDIAGVYINELERVLDPQNPLNKEVLMEPEIGIDYLGFNVTTPPFDDPKVRRAFALALDIDKIIEVSYKGNAERAAGLVPPGIPGHNEALEPLPFDPEQAKQLIIDSKYGSVDNLPPVIFYELRALGPAEEAMIGMWQLNLGVTVEVELIEELEEWYERVHNRELQLFTGGWYADYIDPQNFLEVLFHSQSEENDLAYSNTEVDAALEKAAVEPDEAARLRMYQDIEKLILAELPVVPLYQSWKSHMLVKPYVEGYSMTPIDANYWAVISLKPH